MLEIEWVWTIASLVLGGTLFYFSNTEGVEGNWKSWMALQAGFMVTMGLISLLFLTGSLCNECKAYCKGPDCPFPLEKDK